MMGDNAIGYRIAKLLVRLCMGQITDEEMRELEDWKKTSPENEVLFLRWEEGDFLSEEYAKFKRINGSQARVVMEERIDRNRQIRFRSGILRFGMAAAVVLLTCLVYILVQKEEVQIYANGCEIIAVQEMIQPGKKQAMLQLADGRVIDMREDSMRIEEIGGAKISYKGGKLSYQSEGKILDSLDFNELNVPVGGECFVSLDDGTEVWLNADSKLRYPVTFGTGMREVLLVGEAYFKVVPDSKRPFVVNTSLGDVRVLGTSFGVSVYPGMDGYTTLVAGKVSFESKIQERVVLKPGEQVVISELGKMEMREVDVEEFVGWKDGLFVFNKRSLESIMTILKRWYGITVEFKEDELRSLVFTGNLKRYDQIDFFLESLRRLEGIRYRIDGNRVILYK